MDRVAHRGGGEISTHGPLSSMTSGVALKEEVDLDPRGEEAETPARYGTEVNDRLTRLLARWAPIHQWFSARPVATDTMFALLLLLVSSTLVLVPQIYQETGTTPATLWIWLIVGMVPVAIRRKWIWMSITIVIALLIVSYWEDAAWASGPNSLVVVAYTVAAWRPMRQAVTGNALMWMAGTIQIVVQGYQMGYGFVIFMLSSNYALAVVCFTLGRWVASRRSKDQELHARAHAVEANHAAKVTEAINDERRRIARELHDVVAHHLSVMNVMAAGARRTLRTDPDKADEALSTIETTGRTTLREMRRLLQVLRSDAEQNAEDDQHLTPQPDLDAIHSLVGQIRAAGLNINLVIDGEPQPLDPGVALTIYRIIQEGLTNTLKHAGPARAGVRIQFRDETLDLEVSDTGAGPKSVTTGSGRVGHGLVGMRERVSLYGGTLRTGPRPGGGFRIHAVIPIETATATGSA